MSDGKLNELIKACSAGSRKAQQEIYRSLYGTMMSVCLRYTRDADQAQDILQDGFIKVFGNIDKYNFEGSFEGWVRRIIVNTAIDFHRKKKSDFLLLGENQSVEEFTDVEDEESDEEEYDFSPEEIIAAMQKLTPAYRTIFNLYVFENLTHNEIAEKLGINAGTSKSNFAKAKRNLKRILLNDSKDRDE
jgi:RNA polymerase sigma-70 factor (ECF subfamily)